MHEMLQELLVCTVCKGELSWQVKERSPGRIEKAEAVCEDCGAGYPIQEGIGIFQSPGQRADDYWQFTESELSKFLGSHPEIEKDLMESPENELNPADQFFRAMLLEEQGRFQKARALERKANRGIYTPEHLDCWGEQMDFLIDQLQSEINLMVDLASGRGYLAERAARKLAVPVVVSDFSVQVLRRNRDYFREIGLLDQVSLLAMDALQLPFRDRSLEVLTTNAGLSNIKNTAQLLSEARRVTAGTFRVIAAFYPADDQENIAAYQEHGLEAPVKDQMREYFERAGWEFRIENSCRGTAVPTPTGELLEGAGIDVFPVAETILEWCLITAR